MSASNLSLFTAAAATIGMAGLAFVAIASAGHAQTVPHADDMMASAANVAASVHTPLDRKLAPDKLASMLQRGGYIFLMRHANSPSAVPGAASADPQNTRDERQLDAAGLADAKAFGAGLRRWHIPLGAVFTSPTFRARETLREAHITRYAVVDFLDIRAAPGQPQSPADIAATRQLLNNAPRRGTNTLVVTHYPNIVGQFPGEGRTLGEGDMLVLDASHGQLRVVGAMAIGDWATLRMREGRP